MAMGRVTRFPCPDPQTSYDHFATKLGLETDPSDVRADQQAGAADFVLVDARDTDAFIRTHLPGAIHLDHATIDKETAAHFLPNDRVVVTYGWSNHCNAAEKAAVQLAALGYPVKTLRGGINGWRIEGFPVDGASP